MSPDCEQHRDVAGAIRSLVAVERHAAVVAELRQYVTSFGGGRFDAEIDSTHPYDLTEATCAQSAG